MRFDWTDHGLHGEVRGIRNEETVLALQAGDAASAAAVDLRGAQLGEDLPPALAAMIQEQRDDASAAAVAARDAMARAGALPADTWRGIVQRAARPRPARRAAGRGHADGPGRLVPRLTPRAHATPSGPVRTVPAVNGRRPADHDQ